MAEEIPERDHLRTARIKLQDSYVMLPVSGGTRIVTPDKKKRAFVTATQIPVK